MSRGLSAAAGLALVVAILAAGVAGALVARARSDDASAPPVTTVRRTVAEPIAPAATVPARSHPAARHPAARWLTAPAELRREVAALVSRGGVGVEVRPLDGLTPFVTGTLRTGAGWSTMKVPVVLARVRRTPGGPDASPAVWQRARRAITASDNAAAQGLFDDLAAAAGGVVGASLLVQQGLRDAGDAATIVNTHDPGGGFSTFGQTQWSLSAGTRFFSALARGCLAPRADAAAIVALMRQVQADQRWGLGAGSFPGAASVAFKGGWGPGADGRYLVRQFGIVDGGDGHMAVIGLLARPTGGTFDAGVELLGALAAAVRKHLHVDRVGRAGVCAS
jgi:hypothetical protein